jgi:hypothetical protein
VVVLLLAANILAAAPAERPLFEAIQKGDTAAVKCLLDGGGVRTSGTPTALWRYTRD